MNVDYNKIGINLSKRRKELKLKQYQVCERAGINDKYLSNIEKARSIPSLEVFLKLCDALETTPDNILIGSITESKYISNKVIINKFIQLSDNNKRLCLAFIDMLSNEFE